MNRNSLSWESEIEFGYQSGNKNTLRCIFEIKAYFLPHRYHMSFLCCKSRAWFLYLNITHKRNYFDFHDNLPGFYPNHVWPLILSRCLFIIFYWYNDTFPHQNDYLLSTLWYDTKICFGWQMFRIIHFKIIQAKSRSI